MAERPLSRAEVVSGVTAQEEADLFAGWRPWDRGWMAVREAAEFLGVSRQRIHQLIAEGRIRAQRYGGHALIVEQASVEALVRPRRNGPSPLQGEPGWLPVWEVARSLGVCRQRVHQLIADGRITARRFAGRAFIVEQASVNMYRKERQARRSRK
jgi:excisionase family DNA binding protein